VQIGARQSDLVPSFLAMEPIGIIYAAGQQPLKSFITGINIPPMPDQKSLSAFFAHFSEAEIQMISHGYGRGIYFQAYSLCSALKKARDCPGFFNRFPILEKRSVDSFSSSRYLWLYAVIERRFLSSLQRAISHDLCEISF
jgi:hypothetical protein